MLLRDASSRKMKTRTVIAMHVFLHTSLWKKFMHGPLHESHGMCTYLSNKRTHSIVVFCVCVCVVHAVAVPWWSNQMLLQAKEPAMAIPKLNWSQGLPWLCVFNAIKWARIVWVGCVEIEGDQVEIECIDSHTFKWMIISGMHLRKVLIQNL